MLPLRLHLNDFSQKFSVETPLVFCDFRIFCDFQLRPPFFLRYAFFFCNDSNRISEATHQIHDFKHEIKLQNLNFPTRYYQRVNILRLLTVSVPVSKKSCLLSCFSKCEKVPIFNRGWRNRREPPAKSYKNIFQFMKDPRNPRELFSTLHFEKLMCHRPVKPAKCFF